MATNDKPLPQIPVTGKSSDVATEVLDKLAECGPLLFVQSGVLVRLRGDEAEPLSKDALVHELNCRFDFTVSGKGGVTVVDPPPRVVADILVRVAFGLPTLSGVVRTPFFTSAGRLVRDPGFHKDCGVVLLPDPDLRVAPVSDKPTPEEVETAKRLLMRDLLGRFPFVSQTDIAHTVGCALQPFVREMIDGPRPLFAFDASRPGSGKGALVHSLTIIATGREAEVQPGVEKDELRKRITSILLSGAPQAFFDNATRRVDSGSFAALLTSKVWRDRILGVTKMSVALPNRTQWFISGNNIRFSDEMLRRTVRVRLEPQVENPEERKFGEFLLPGWAKAHRAELVWACLTLVQNWIAKGGVPFTEIALGSFESWAKATGGILRAAGIEGFLQDRARFRQEADERGANWRAFIAAWAQDYGTAVVTAKELYDLAKDTIADEMGDGNSDRSQQTRLGLLLGERRGWITGEWKLMAAKGSDDKSRPRNGWKLEPAEIEKEELKGAEEEEIDEGDPWTNGANDHVD